MFLSNKIKNVTDSDVIGFDAIEEWEVTESAKVTSNPVEDGSNIADHYYLENTTATFSGVITPFNYGSSGVDEDPDEFVRAVQALKSSKVPFDLYLSTDLQPITNCLITSFSYKRTQKEGLSLLIDMTVEQVDIVEAAAETTISKEYLASDVEAQAQSTTDGGDASSKNTTLQDVYEGKITYGD